MNYAFIFCLQDVGDVSYVGFVARSFFTNIKPLTITVPEQCTLIYFIVLQPSRLVGPTKWLLVPAQQTAELAKPSKAVPSKLFFHSTNDYSLKKE